MNFNFDNLYGFYQAIKCGGIRKASRVLNMTPAGVSKQVSHLEKKLDCRLIKASKFGVTVTPEGEKLYNQLKKIFPMFSLVDEWFEEKEGLSGRLTVATWHGIAYAGISKHIHKFYAQNPNFTLKIKADNIMKDFEDYSSDAVISLKMDKRNDLIQRKIFDCEFGLFASKEYLKEHGAPKNISELDNHRLIAASDDMDVAVHDKSEWHLTEGASKMRTPHFIVNSTVAIEEAAKNSMGIASMPTYWVSEETGLVRILEDYPSPIMEFYFIYPNYAKNVKKLVAFETFLSSCLLRN